MKKSLDLVICGVGGQGIILISNLVGTACLLEGLPVTGTETHGMAQRGGSVEAHLRIGNIFGPKVPVGKADLLMALEPLEAARYAYYLKSDGLAVVNTAEIKPVGWKTSYPGKEQLVALVKKTGAKVLADDFTSQAKKLGSVKVLNTLMLGVTGPFLPLSSGSLLEALRLTVPEKFFLMNQRALKWGYDYSSPKKREGRG